MVPKKEFVIRHVIEDVSKMDDGQEFKVEEEHFGIPWCLHGVRRWNGDLDIFLFCEKSTNTPWSIDTHLEFKLIPLNGDVINKRRTHRFSSSEDPDERWESDDFILLVELMDYKVDSEATIEYRVVIEKMEGCGKTEILKRFDESVKDCSDVVLVVENRKFYLSKFLLALQSSYFKGLLLGNFEESKKEEVTLNEIDPHDFQKFLELIHGESAVDDDTVSGILSLADMYDAPTAIRRCEEFLMEKSKLEMKRKLQLSLRYKLEALKTKCLSEINTIDEIQSIMSAQIPEMDLETSQALLQKTLDLCLKPTQIPTYPFGHFVTYPFIFPI